MSPAPGEQATHERRRVCENRTPARGGYGTLTFDAIDGPGGRGRARHRRAAARLPQRRRLRRPHRRRRGRRASTRSTSSRSTACCVDVMLPGSSGFELCRRIRESSDVPLLFLTARGDDSDKLRGLGLGADDYIVKSATPAEVVARVKAVLRRAPANGNGAAPDTLRFGELTIDLAAHEVALGDRPVRLTARELELLRVFAEHPRQVLGRDQLFELLWGSWGDRSAVSVYVRKLREKLEADPARPQLLVTVWGVGYRFDPPVGAMRRRLRSLPLGVWLALGFALAVAAPALTAGATWWAVGARQQADVDASAARGDRADRADRSATSGTPAPSAPCCARSPSCASRPTCSWARRRRPLRSGSPASPSSRPTARSTKSALVAEVPADSSRRRWPPRCSGAGRQARAHRRATRCTSWRPGRSRGRCSSSTPARAVRLAAASAAGLVALALALIAGVVLLRRWVVAPLARLAADAERIAGGELDVAPVNSRTREVAEVGAALQGMADGLRGALAEQHAAEQQRRFLVSAIAHDLRTPLFTLRGSLEAIEHGIGDADQLRRAQDKATLLDRLVGDLFTFSRLEYAGPELALRGARPRGARARGGRHRRPAHRRRRGGHAAGAGRRPRGAPARARQPARQRRAPCALGGRAACPRRGRRGALRGPGRRPGHRARRPAAAVRAAVPRRSHPQQRHRRRRPRAGDRAAPDRRSRRERSGREPPRGRRALRRALSRGAGPCSAAGSTPRPS